MIQQEKEDFYRWVVVAIIWCSHTIYFLNSMSVGTLAPLMKSELNLNSVRIGFMTSAISVGSMVFQIPFGVLADRFGVKWVMVGGLALVGSSAILVLLVYSYLPMLVILLFLGAGIAANQTPGSKAIIMWFPKKGRATGMGIKQTGVSMGGILAPALLPVVAQHYSSWRYSFALAGLAAIGSAFLIIFFYNDPPHYRETAEDGVHSFQNDVLKLFKNRDFLLICVIGIFLMVTQFSLIAHLMLYASSGLGFSLIRSGFLVSLFFAGGFLGRIGWGVFSDYILGGNRKTILVAIGASGITTVCAFLVIGQIDSGVPVYFLTVLLGVTAMGWNAIYLTKVGEIAGGRLAATATGISFVVTNIGAICGPPLFGYLVDISGTYTLSWCLLGLCMIFVVFLSIILKKESILNEV